MDLTPEPPSLSLAERVSKTRELVVASAPLLIDTVPVGSPASEGGASARMAALASTILPVALLPLVLETGLPVSIRAFFRARGLRRKLGVFDATNAAAPVAWGVAIEVPL